MKIEKHLKTIDAKVKLVSSHLFFNRKQRFDLLKCYRDALKYSKDWGLKETEDNLLKATIPVLELKTLDILFIHSNLGLLSKIIRFVIRARYNHVAIVFEDCEKNTIYIQEAIPKYGVIMTELNEWIKKYKPNRDLINVARPRQDINHVDPNFLKKNERLHEILNDSICDCRNCLTVDEYFYKYRYKESTKKFVCSTLAEFYLRKTFKIYNYELPRKTPGSLEDWLYRENLITQLHPLIF